MQQEDISNLVPKSLGTYWLLFFGGLALIAGLEFAYFKMPDIAGRLGVESLSPFDVLDRGSILNWGLSVAFLLTACFSLVNFRLGRKHGDASIRVNAWFWSALLLIFVSLDVQVALRDTLRDILVQTSGTTLYRDGTVWSLGLYLFFCGIVGSRILLDMTSYTPALGLFVLAVAAGISGLLIEQGIPPLPLEPALIAIATTGSKALAALLFFLATMLFARRQVFRDPEAALRWFAKVWKQTPVAAEKKSKETPPKSPAPAEKPASTKSSPGNGSGILTPSPARPLVQKQASDVVPFKSSDDDFDLAGIA